MKAKLSFAVWNMELTKGVQVAGGEGQSDRPKRVEGEFFLKLGEKYVKVAYREGRKSPAYQYIGPGQCVFYAREQATDEEGREHVYKPIGQVMLPQSGEYVVMLRTLGGKGGKNGKLTTILLPYSDQFLEKGMISVMNFTDREVVLVPDNQKRKLALKPKASGKIKLKSADASGVFLQMYSRKSSDDPWKIEFSRAYSIFKNAKSACILYQEKQGGGVKVKFFSGLDK